MTGRNHTTNGMATITEAASGFPSSNGHIPFECATIAEVLGERGWNTYMTGKWHLTAEDEMNMASRKSQWSVGRGFERFYGFLGAETNQWYPDLVYDNHPVQPPRSPEEGYHLTEDLTDKALEFIQDAQAVAPDKPFFLYYCPGRATLRITRRRSGSRSTAASSTWATRRTGNRCSSGRSRWGSSPTRPSCRRSTRTSTPRAQTARVGPRRTRYGRRTP